MKKRNDRIFIPLCFIGMMFFTVGFATGINGYFVPFLETNLQLSSAESYLVVAATFSAFLIFSYPSSKVIEAVGYKRTMSLSLVLFAAAFAIFIPAASMSSFILYLLACFLSGTANTMLQAAINPYVTILGSLESAAKRISIMGICNSLALGLPSVFIAAVTHKSVDSVTLVDLDVPFYIIIGIALVLAIIVLFAPLEEIKAKGEENDEDCPYAAGKTSIWQFPHLIFGALSLFVYVGVENIALLSMLDYAQDAGIDSPERFTLLPGLGMAIGYVAGIIFIPKYISQVTALKICTWTAIVTTMLVVLTPIKISVWCVSLLSLSCSLMYPAIWPLAIDDLGKYTKTGSSILVASIGGGALIPLIYGVAKDILGSQQSYWICLPFFLIILFYSYKGYKIRN